MGFRENHSIRLRSSLAFGVRTCCRRDAGEKNGPFRRVPRCKCESVTESDSRFVCSVCGWEHVVPGRMAKKRLERGIPCQRCEGIEG